MRPNFEQLNKLFTEYLQQHLTFKHYNKVIKSGRLLLFHITDYHINMVLMCDNKRKVYEVPIPFSIKATDNMIEFDYRPSLLNSTKLNQFLMTSKSRKTKKSRFFDSSIFLSLS